MALFKMKKIISGFKRPAKTLGRINDNESTQVLQHRISITLFVTELMYRIMPFAQTLCVWNPHGLYSRPVGTLCRHMVPLYVPYP